LDLFFEEEADIGTQSFLSISIGCNKKGTDAIHTARLGLSDPTFDVPVWNKKLKDLEGYMVVYVEITSSAMLIIPREKVRCTVWNP
jgi:hypothetical protein